MRTYPTLQRTRRTHRPTDTLRHRPNHTAERPASSSRRPLLRPGSPPQAAGDEATTGGPVSLPALDSATLTYVARRAARCGALELVSWSVAPMAPGLGAATGGLFRVSGHAAAPGASRLVPWSVVLKILRPPAGRYVGGLGVAPEAWGASPHDPYYWQREALVYRSGLLETLPRGLAAPRWLETTELATAEGATLWLWLEHVRDTLGERWPVERYARAAYLLGAFNGASLASPAHPHEAHAGYIMDAPWLSRGLLRSWVEQRCAYSMALVRDAATWRHPTLRAMFPVPVAHRLERLWDEREQFCAALERLPQVLCHLDASRRNVFARPRAGGHGEEELVLLDWECAGYGAVGQELASLVGATLSFGTVDWAAAPRLERAALDAYLAGLRAAGWRADPRTVRFAFAATAALQLGLIAPVLHLAVAEPHEPVRGGCAGIPGRPGFAHQARLTYYLLDLADEARALLRALD